MSVEQAFEFEDGDGDEIAAHVDADGDMWIEINGETVQFGGGASGIRSPEPDEVRKFAQALLDLANLIEGRATAPAVSDEKAVAEVVQAGPTLEEKWG